MLIYRDINKPKYLVYCNRKYDYCRKNKTSDSSRSKLSDSQDCKNAQLYYARSFGANIVTIYPTPVSKMPKIFYISDSQARFRCF